MRTCCLPLVLSALALIVYLLGGVAQAQAREGVGFDSTAVADSVTATVSQEMEVVDRDTLTEAGRPAEAETAADSSRLPAPRYRLGDIVVTAAKLTGSLEKMPAGVFVVERHEIEERLDETVLSVLKDKEGINPVNYGSSGALELISLRGSRFGSVPTLLDGIPINNEQLGTVDLNTVPSSVLERIEILRGPLGLLQGGNGVVGAVNFVTAEPGLKEKPTARIGFSSGSFAYRKHVASFARYYGKLGTFFGIEGTSSDGVGAYRDYSSNSYFGKLNYDFGEKRKVAFLVSSYSGDLRFAEEAARQKSDATRLQLVSSIPVGADTRLELRAFHSREKTDYKSPPYDTTLSELARYGALADFYKYGTITGDVACGGGFTRSGLDLEYLSSSSNPKTWEGYVFAEDQLTLLPGFKALASVRVDHHSRFGTETSPCVCFWREMDNGKVWFSSGRGFNPPTLNDLFWPAGMYGKGNEDLKAESSLMAELGSDLSLLNRSVRAGISCYLSRTSDHILWLPGSDGAWAPVNIERVNSRGIEAGLGFVFRGESVGGINVTLQEIEYGENVRSQGIEYRKGESLPYMPRARTNFWLSKDLEPLPDLVVNFGMEATYVSKQLDKPLEQCGAWQDPFFVMEGKFSATLAGFTAFARLRNATNESYPSRLTRPGQYCPPVYYRMPKRNYDVGIMFELLD